MRFDLPTLIRRTRNPRRSAITLRDIRPPATLAGNLYARAYRPVIELWQRAAERVMAEYERSLAQQTQDAPIDLFAILDDVASEYTRLFITIRTSLDQWALQVESWQRGKWRGAVLSASGVDIGTLIGAGDMRAPIETHVEWNAALVKDVSDVIRKKIGDAVFTGLRERRTAREVAREISDAIGGQRARATRIASDQLSKLSSSLAAERRREAGITIYRYRHSGKLHPRPWHRDRDGKLFADDEADTGRVIGGETVNAPIDSGDQAGQPPYCGCREQAFIDLS